MDGFGERNTVTPLGQRANEFPPREAIPKRRTFPEHHGGFTRQLVVGKPVR